MRRVLVLGAGGAGKTTVSVALGQRLQLPVVHLDQHFWGPSWTPSEPEVWATRLATLLAQDRWVMDGNFTTSLPQRLARATHVVFLDLPRRQYLPAVLLRGLQNRSHRRADLPEGCNETLNPGFLQYLWRFGRHTRPRVLAALEASDRPVLQLRSRAEATRWLAGVQAQPRKGAGTSAIA